MKKLESLKLEKFNSMELSDSIIGKIIGGDTAGGGYWASENVHVSWASDYTNSDGDLSYRKMKREQVCPEE